MRIEKFKHENVLPNGTFKNRPGAIEVNGMITLSHFNGGCGLEGCNCSEGHWINVALPRTNKGIVEGITLYLDSREQVLDFIKAFYESMDQ